MLLADELVITKVDLVEPEARDELAAQLAPLNPGAMIRTAVHGVIEEGYSPVAARRT